MSVVQFRVFEIKGGDLETNEPGWYWTTRAGTPVGPLASEDLAEQDAVATIQGPYGDDDDGEYRAERIG